MLAAEASELPVAAGVRATVEPVANAASRWQGVVVAAPVQHDFVPEPRPRAEELAEPGVAVYAAKTVVVGHYEQCHGAHAQSVKKRQRVPTVVKRCRGYVVKRDAEAGQVRGHLQSCTPVT